MLFCPPRIHVDTDFWTGGGPLGVDDRAAFLKRVENKQYNVRDLDSVKVPAKLR